MAQDISLLQSAEYVHKKIYRFKRLRCNNLFRRESHRRLFLFVSHSTMGKYAVRLPKEIFLEKEDGRRKAGFILRQIFAKMRKNENKTFRK